jgi:hypothetical protein
MENASQKRVHKNNNEDKEEVDAAGSHKSRHGAW